MSVKWEELGIDRREQLLTLAVRGLAKVAKDRFLVPVTWTDVADTWGLGITGAEKKAIVEVANELEL